MKRMKKWVGLITLIGLSVNVLAMEISSPQVVVHTNLVKKYGKQAAESFTEKEYKKKLVTYVKESTTADFINKRLFCPAFARYPSVHFESNISIN